MKHNNFKKKAIAIAIGLTTLSGAAYAAELEVITVTSQKRIQTMADVPVSMQVATGDMLDELSIVDFGGLVERLPNVYLGSSPSISSISMRGVGTGTDNAAAEQSVGMYVDGTYLSRGFQFNAPFTDVERVEVLKGPQGVLQGKNSVAGAIVITTRRPTDDFEARVRTGYEIENGGYNLEGMVSGGISDNLFARVVVQNNLVGGWLDTNSRLSQDGVMLNGEKDQNEDEFSIFRLSLVWEPTDDLTLFGKVETGERKVRGTSFSGLKNQPGATYAGVPIDAFFLSKDPNYDTIDNGVVSNGFNFTYNPETNKFEADNKPLETAVDSASFTGQIDYEIEQGTLTGITSYSAFEQSRAMVTTMAPTDWLVFRDEKGDGGEEFDQLTQEIRFVSADTGAFTYIVGAFYMDRNIKYDGATSAINFSNGNLPFSNFDNIPDDYQTAFVYQFFDAANERHFDENTESYSAFGQVTWNVNDDVRINVGARYTDETKEVEYSFQPGPQGSNLVIFDPVLYPGRPDLNAFSRSVFGVEYFTTADLPRSKISNSSLDPSVSVQWDVNQDIMLYGSYTKATKAGGFNSSANSPDITSFDSERATGYEIGLKGSFLEGTLLANVALYNTSFDDLQVSALDSNTNSFFFKNAAEATTQGLEADIRYAVTDSVEIGGALAYLDATFDDFPGASCSGGISKEANCDPVTSTRNAKGDKLRFSPDWAGNLYATYKYDLSNGMKLDLRGDLIYSDDYFWGSQNDAYMVQDAFTKVDFSVNLTSAEGDWKVSLIGKNLTDETTVSYGGATPQAIGAYYSNVDKPRQIFLTAEYNWF